MAAQRAGPARHARRGGRDGDHGGVRAAAAREGEAVIVRTFVFAVALANGALAVIMSMYGAVFEDYAINAFLCTSLLLVLIVLGEDG